MLDSRTVYRDDYHDYRYEIIRFNATKEDKSMTWFFGCVEIADKFSIFGNLINEHLDSFDGIEEMISVQNGTIFYDEGLPYQNDECIVFDTGRVDVEDEMFALTSVNKECKSIIDQLIELERRILKSERNES